jgi:plastocyanin domain-containing protein
MRCMRALLLASVVVFGVFGCSKDEKKSEPPAAAPPAAKAPVTADSVRRVSVEAGKEGYVPDRIPGKPGEKLTLVFTRTVEADCISQLKTPDGKLVDLPMGKPVEIAVTVPQTGELGFACGMDMFHGVIVADPKS